MIRNWFGQRCLRHLSLRWRRQCQWFELGELVYAQARQREDLADNLLQPVRGDEVPGRAPRPKCSTGMR